MKLSYQSIKQIDRFSGIFIWVVVAPYAFAVALIFMWAFYIKDNPTARISDFVIPVCTGITCVATMANGFFSFDANRKRVRMDQRLPAIEASCTKIKDGVSGKYLNISFPNVSVPFIVYKIQLPAGWKFSDRRKNAFVQNTQIHFNQGSFPAQELHFHVLSPLDYPDDYCLQISLHTSLREELIKVEAVIE